MNAGRTYVFLSQRLWGSYMNYTELKEAAIEKLNSEGYAASVSTH